MTLKSFLALVGLALAILGIVFNFWGMAPAEMTVTPDHPVARSLLDTLVWFWTYLTHLVTVCLALIYLAGVTDWRALDWFRRPSVQTGALAYILVVAVYYVVMIEPAYPGVGISAVATWLLHKIGPAVFLIWWAYTVPHGQLKYRQVGLMILPAIPYAAWVLIRGAIVNDYPYAIFDPANGGYGSVALGLALVVLAMVAVAVLFVFIDGLLAPRTATA